MILTYAPDDGDKQEWRFRGDRLMTTEAEAIEKVTAFTYADFGRKLLEGNPTARRAVVWVLRKRTEPTLRFGDVDFPMGALTLDFEDEEKEAMRQAISDDRSLSEEDKMEALAEIGFSDLDGADVAEIDPKDEAEAAEQV